MSTKYKISEQVHRLIAGNPSVSGRIHRADVLALVGQVINKRLKAEVFSVNMPEGDTVPPNCMVYTYDNVAVTTYKTTKCKAELPAMPINLPRNMGVLHVSKTDAIDEPFIPVPTSMYGIVKPIELVGDTSELITYEVVGSIVIINFNLPGAGVNSVYIRLVGADLSSLSDYDMLPITAEMEADVVSEVYKMLVGVPPADRAETSRE